MQRMTLADYPGAPEGAYVCEEGWLCIGREAWARHEWNHGRGRWRSTGRPIQYHDARHIRRRIQKREYRARIRAEREPAV